MKRGHFFETVLRLVGCCLFLSLTARAQDFKKPFMISKATTRVSLDSVYRYTVYAGDSTGKTLTMSAPVLPAWLTFDVASRTLVGKPRKAGQYAVQLHVTNGVMATDQFFIITVVTKTTTNILCLGNSITNGTDKFNSYRRPLWKLLHDGNYNFDFVGSWDKHHWGGEVPDPDFDLDHDGHSGWTAAHILHPPVWDSTRGNIRVWLKSYRADIVLLELGTNDVFQCRTPENLIQNFSELVAIFRAQNPTVKIVLALVLPLGKKWSVQNLCNTEAYGNLVLKMNDAIRKFAPTITSKKSPVAIVDLNTGIDPDEHLYDDIHPNDKGEAIMAQRWFSKIKKQVKKL